MRFDIEIRALRIYLDERVLAVRFRNRPVFRSREVARVLREGNLEWVRRAVAERVEAFREYCGVAVSPVLWAVTAVLVGIPITLLALFAATYLAMLVAGIVIFVELCTFVDWTIESISSPQSPVTEPVQSPLISPGLSTQVRRLERRRRYSRH